MTQELAARAPAMNMGTLSDPRELGTVLAASGYFSDARDAAQAVVKVLAGAELGFGPIASMTGVYIVKGRITLSANLMAAAIKRHPKYDYRIHDISDTKAVVQFFQRVGGEWRDEGTSEFTMDDARKAGLAGGENWKKYPRNMLLWRAMSNGAKFYCPDAFAGPVYLADELGAEIDGETGEVIDVDVTAGTPSRPSESVPASDDRASEPPTPPATPTTTAEPAGVVETPADPPPPTPDPTEDPDRLVTPEEVAKLTEYLESLNVPEGFVRMGLMTHGAANLESLSVGQAHNVMDNAKRRFGKVAT